GDIFTYSRGALLAIIAMCGMLWLRSRQKLWFGLLLVAGAVAVVEVAPTEWFDRVATIKTYEEEQPAEARLCLWRMAWEIPPTPPVTGAGCRWSFNPAIVNPELIDPGVPRLSMSRAPHSNWFQMLSDHGFIGLGLFIAILIGTAVDAQWLVRRSRGD